MKIKTVQTFNAAKPNLVVAEWADGKKSVYDLDTLPETVTVQMMHHGAKQKLMDAHSGTYKETGSVSACREVTDAVWANLLTGEFNSDRAGSPWIIEALSQIFDVEEDRAEEIWKALDAKQQKAVFKDSKIVEWKAKRDMERAKAAPDSGLDIAALFAAKAE